MEKFIGSFKAIPELLENFEEYFVAMKIPTEAKEEMRKSMENLVTSIFKEAEGVYKEHTDYGGRTEEFLFKLGEPTTTTTLGMKTTNTFTLSADGNSLEGVSDVVGQITTSSRYFQGEHMVFEATGNGVTMKTYFNRV